MTTLLRTLRRRVRQYIVLDSVLAALAVVLAAFWLGLLLDYGPVWLGGTEMPRSARLVVLLALLVILVILAGRLFIGRLRRQLPDDSLALLVERQKPELGGRFLTAVQLLQADRPDDPHSPALLQRVHEEAVERAEEVDLNRIFRWRPIKQKALLVAPLVLALVGLGVVAPQVLRLATSRLLLATDAPWPRKADLQMVGLEVPRVTAAEDDVEAIESLRFEDRRVRVAKGTSATLRILARADGAIVPDVCTLYYQTADGMRGQTNLRRVGRVTDGYQAFVLEGSPLSSLTEDLQLTVRGLDARLDDYVIETVPPPALRELKVEATYPEYLRDDPSLAGPDRTTDYQPGLRLREGSTLRLVGSSSKPLSQIDVSVTAGDVLQNPPSIQLSEDGRTFSFSLDDLREPSQVVLVPIDREGIAAQAPFRYFLGVVRDATPEIEMRLAGISGAVTAEARLPVVGAVVDDYGVTAADVSVVPTTQANPQPASRPLQQDREGNFETALDLRELVNAGRLPPLEPGQSINVFAEATDAYDLGAEHVVRSEVFPLDIVTGDDLLSLLERRELGLRARLEQTIAEMQSLRDALELLRREGWAPEIGATAFSTRAQDGDPDEMQDEANRALQVLRLRVQQSVLQATKTREELNGIAASVDDILEEMINNRVDSIDRRERLSEGVADPLRAIVAGSLADLIQQIEGVQGRVEQPPRAVAQTAAAVQTADRVVVELTAVLEKMLDLESYNEILNMLRSLMDSQDGLIEDTQREQQDRIRDLFQSAGGGRKVRPTF